MRSVLGQPYPYAYSPRTSAIIAIIVSLFIGAFLYATEPFNLSSLSQDALWRVCVGYGFVTLFCIVLYMFAFPALFPGYYHEDKWTLGREITQVGGVLIVISIFNFFYGEVIDFRALNDPETPLGRLVQSTVATFVVGMLPSTTIVFINYARLRSRYSTGAAAINERISSKPVVKEPDHDLVSIQSESEAEAIQFDPENLVLVAASGN